MTLTNISYELQEAVMAGRITKAEAQRRANGGRTIVYGATFLDAANWLAASGIDRRDALIITMPYMSRGRDIKPEDRVVFVGEVEFRSDYREVVAALLPALKNVGGHEKIEHVA